MYKYFLSTYRSVSTVVPGSPSYSLPSVSKTQLSDGLPRSMESFINVTVTTKFSLSPKWSSQYSGPFPFPSVCPHLHTVLPGTPWTVEPLWVHTPHSPSFDPWSSVSGRCSVGVVWVQRLPIPTSLLTDVGHFPRAREGSSVLSLWSYPTSVFNLLQVVRRKRVSHPKVIRPFPNPIPERILSLHPGYSQSHFSDLHLGMKDQT